MKVPKNIYNLRENHMSVSHAAIHKNMIILAIISFILTLLPVTGYGDDWVKVEENDAFSEYYNKSKIDINRAKKQFTVLQKMKWTEKGRNNLKSAFIFFGITP
jgi:hypothetical protein